MAAFDRHKNGECVGPLCVWGASELSAWNQFTVIILNPPLRVCGGDACCVTHQAKSAAAIAAAAHSVAGVAATKGVPMREGGAGLLI